MLAALCGMVPSSLLVWADPNSAVTGETGGGVASPQKSSERNKPSKHNDFISFNVRLWAAPKEVLLPTPKKKRKLLHKAALAMCKSSFPASLQGCFYFFFSITLLSFSHLFSCCCSACANVFTLCFIGHLSALMALWSVFLSVHVSVLFYCCSAAICFWVLF